MEEDPLTQPQPHPRPVGPGMPNLEIPADLKIEYVNLVRIAHSPSDLVFDFALMVPGMASARVKSRIVMSPLGAKLFFRALADNLARYETAFGEISIPGGASLAEQLFKPPTPPEDTKE